MEKSEVAGRREAAEFDVSGSLHQPEFDRLAALAARVFAVPVALVMLIERDRRYIKAKVGTQLSDTPLAISFCADAVAGSGIVVVEDATRDHRVSSHPLVTGNPNIRFYAAAPLIDAGGKLLGSLCLIDFKPRRHLDEEQRNTLADLANLATQQIELSRRKQKERRADNAQRLDANAGRTFRLLVESITDYAIYLLDPDGIVTNWNSGAERLKGYAPQEIVGQSFARFYTPEDRVACLPQRALQCAANEGRFLTEGWRVRKDGSRFWASVVIETIRDTTGTIVGFAKITRDVTERKRHEQHLHHLAHFDSLTGLPNRAAFNEQLEAVVKSAAPAAILVLDLDGFKQVNDTLGHAAGDAVIKAAAARTKACIGERGITGRLGGDEIAAMITSSGDPKSAGAVCEELLAAFRRPFYIDQEEVHLGVSIGVALSPHHGKSADELLGNADLALYRAKRNGRHGYNFFQPAMRHVAFARQACERELHQAFANGELELFFQPQVRLGDGQLVAAEALLRWRHPQRGVLAPAAFIDVLERSSLAHPVGGWILNTACAFASRVRQAGLKDFRIAVNLFGAQFRSGELVQNVTQALMQSGLTEDALELEITETIYLQNTAEMLSPLQQLRSRGIGIAFDDYGTGFASLSLLKKFPLTRLKIDKSFIRDLCSNSEDAAVVRAIVFLAENFGLDVLAEGVEDSRQESALRELGCKHAQGFLFGRPVPADEFLNGVALPWRTCNEQPGFVPTVELAS